MTQQPITEKHTEALSGSNLSQFFADELKSIYKGEKDLLEPLSIFQQAASLAELKELVTTYMLVLHQQAIRLERILNILSVQPDGGTCPAMEGICLEMKLTLEKTAERTTTRDAAIVIAIQKAVHYKIAEYGSLEQLATSMGMEEVTDLLNQSLKEEKDHDLLFSDIAEKRINWLAETE